MTQNIIQCKFDSKIGALYLVATAKGLKGLYLSKQSMKVEKIPSKATTPEYKIILDTVKALTLYLDGKNKNFDIPLDFEGMGTEFQRKVWNCLSKIPYGKTFSYKDIAKKIGNPKAMRAVGSANGKNPISIIVPCHRVIAADGTLGGYSGGLAFKRKLLSLENLNF